MVDSIPEHMPPDTEVYMNLFIETPRQQAQRLASASGALAARGAHGLFSGVQKPAAAEDEAAVKVRAEAAVKAAASVPEAVAARQAARPEAPRDASAPAEEPYSIAQEAYRQELDYDRRRVRGRRRKTMLRVLLTIVLVPILLFAAFIASYVLTCVLNGATPEELAQLMAKLFGRIGTFLSTVGSQLSLPVL